MVYFSTRKWYTFQLIYTIFFGQPLIDAYLLQEELSFYGIAVHATAEQAIVKLEPMPFIRNYFCPFKNGSAWNLTIEPMFAKYYASEDLKQNENCKALFESIKKLRYKTSGHLRKYIDNTESYLNEIEAKK